MRVIDGVLVHGSPGSFGIRGAAIPASLCDDLDLAWRAHHAARRATDPLHGAMALAAVEEMEAEWLQRERYSPPQRDEGDDALAPGGESSSGETSDGDGDSSDPEGIWTATADDIVAARDVHLCAHCQEATAAMPDDAPPSACPPAGPSDPICQVCGQQEAGSGMPIANDHSAVAACAACFQEHFAWWKPG